MTGGVGTTTGWLEAFRELAAAQVHEVRERWSGRGRAGTAHDAVDDILSPVTTSPEMSESDPVREARALAREAIGADPRWQHLLGTFGVPAREAQWLCLLAACELDPRLTRVLGYLDDSITPAPPTPATGALLWAWTIGYQPGPAGALARWRLAGPAGEGPWQSTSAWSLDADVAGYLAGDPDWAAFRDGVTMPQVDALDCLHPDLLEELRAASAAILDAGVAGCEVELVGEPGSGRRTLLAQLARALGRTPALVAGDDPVRALRTAFLLQAAPIWCADADGLVGADAAAGGLTLVARRTAARPAAPGVVRLSRPMPTLGRSQRQRLWAARTPSPAPHLVTGWELSPADLAAGAVAAAAGPALAADVIRRRLRAGTIESMTALACPYEWDQLILSDRVGAQLIRLRNQVLHSQEVLDDWEFRRLCPTAAGITALFAGPSGTGKTMAAQVLARSLDLDLYRVDLAEVVNKYIGETEKRLAAVFAECERSNVMVLFDEADALFGQRTRVRDAHDRYANIEIDYLLQRLDTFRGVAVLATNRRNDLDSAFLRRLRVVVDFVAPAPAERLRLWHQALPSHTSAGEAITSQIDRQWLADHLELTGAEITSIVLSAAFDARERGGLIETEHLLEASRRELVKRGAVLRLEPPVGVAR